MREAGIAFRPLLDFARQEVVAFARLANRRCGVAFDLYAGAGERQYRALDPGAIHRLQTLVAEIIEPRHHPADDVRIDIADRGLPIVFKTGRQEVLFERNLFDHASLKLAGLRGSLYLIADIR